MATSVQSSGTQTQPLSGDSTLVNAKPYTFIFSGGGASNDAMAQAIVDNAPNYVSALAVSVDANSNVNVAFTYEGDGTDDVSDVAASLVAAIQAETGVSLSFIQVNGQSSTATPGSSVTPNPTGPTYSFSIRNLLPTWLGGAAVTPEQQASYTAASQAEIATVPANATTAYGTESSAAAATTSAATTQETASVADNTTIATQANAALAAASASQLTMLYTILGIAAAAAVAYFVFITGGFNRRSQ